MKIIEQQIQFGDLILTIEEGSKSGKKNFRIDTKEDNETVIGTRYEGDINLSDLFDCLNKVNNFFRQL